MAVPPKFAGHLLACSMEAKHTIELFLDFVCPFSAKMFKTIHHDVRPIIESKYSGGVRLIFRQQIQPWHPSSTLVHEAAAAVLKTAPNQFWAFSDLLFQNQKEYFDANVVHEPRNKTYERLAQLAGQVKDVDSKTIYSLLEISDKPTAEGGLNTGNGVTDDLKQMVKAARLTGVHVSPTVLFNGIEARDISSGWTAEQWEEWLSKNIR